MEKDYEFRNQTQPETAKDQAETPESSPEVEQVNPIDSQRAFDPRSILGRYPKLRRRALSYLMTLGLATAPAVAQEVGSERVLPILRPGTEQLSAVVEKERAEREQAERSELKRLQAKYLGMVRALQERNPDIRVDSTRLVKPSMVLAFLPATLSRC